MSPYGAAQLLAETVGVRPDDVFITWSRFKANWCFGREFRAVRPAARTE